METKHLEPEAEGGGCGYGGCCLVLFILFYLAALIVTLKEVSQL